MYNFFVNNKDITDNKAIISGSDYNHIVNVLRFKVGQKFYISNNDNYKSYLSEIVSIEKDKIICKLISENISTELKIDVSIFQGIPKSDKMDLIIQKCTELGANDFYPVEMKNCVMKLNNEESKIERWQKIAESSSKQSKRNRIPKVNGKINFEEMIEIVKKYDLSIVAYENEEKTTIKQILLKNRNIKNIAIIIGPEGGISENEYKILCNNGIKSVSLGKRILRTETAPITMLSMINYEYEL